MNTEFEQIVPWNGAQDTGRDVRLKWQRNFEKIAQALQELVEKDQDYEDILNDILKELKNFLRKDKPDSTNYLLSLFGGAIFGKNGFASGLTGFGAKIDDKGYGEMRGLTLWEWLQVPELRYNRVEVFLGIKWRTPGGGIILTCTPDKDAEGNDLSTGTCTLKLEDGEFGAVSLDDIVMGIYHFGDDRDATADSDDSKGNLSFSGFATAYFRITGVSGDNNETFTYSLRPGYSIHPQPQMHFACYGNFTNTDRQTSVYETRTYTRYLWKQNTWEISAANIAQQNGDLSNLNVHGMQMEGYSTYLNSVYFTGRILQTKPDGTPVRTANDRGAWEAGSYDFYDRVSHNGCIWLCVNENGTDAEPSDSSADWLKQVDKGADGSPGQDGASVTNLGDWQTGLFVPYLGIVRMGDASWQCINKSGTSNPPLWCYTDESGNRLQLTEDGGVTYGYVLTGEENTTEYELIARNGENGTDGVPGEPGKDGKTLYTWIRYADDAQGTGISNNPAGKEYIGFAYNKDTATESNEPSDYIWSLIKGTQGVPGEPGEDGTQYYTWIAYSDNADGSGMYQLPNDNTKYIGIAVNKLTATESNNPADYTWSKFKGDPGEPGADGTSITFHGNWQSGLFVPYMGTVRMGGKLWLCTKESGSSNPPCYIYLDNDGNRLMLTQDNGGTYGYVLTGEYNTAEYEIAAEDGEPGADGKPGADGEKGDDGKQGIQGCILRKSEWESGTEYRNDEALTSGTRYLDVALVRDNTTATGWKAYKCKQTHTSSSSNAPGNTSYWEEFGLNTTAIFTSLIIAKNALIDFMSGNQLLIRKDDGTITAGLSGSQSGSKVRIWAGSATPDSAPFRVLESGKVIQTDSEVHGTIYATDGKVAGFSISGNSLTNEGFNNNASVIFRNDNYKTFAGIGGNVFPAVMGGVTCVGRFENCDSSDVWGVNKNVAIYLKAEGAGINYAFMGIGNGFLNGAVEGFAVQYISTDAKTSNISKGRYTILYSSSGEIRHVLPTRLDVQDTLGIGSTTPFAILLHFLCKYTSPGTARILGRNSEFTNTNTSQYPYLYDQNGSVASVTMYKGDSLSILLVYDGYDYYAQIQNRND